jgi:hypothetical protein
MRNRTAGVGLWHNVLQKSYPLTQWDFTSGVGLPIISHRLFCIQNQQFFTTGGACLEVVIDFEWRTFHIGSLRAKFILSSLGMS